MLIRLSRDGTPYFAENHGMRLLRSSSRHRSEKPHWLLCPTHASGGSRPHRCRHGPVGSGQVAECRNRSRCFRDGARGHGTTHGGGSGRRGIEDDLAAQGHSAITTSAAATAAVPRTTLWAGRSTAQPRTPGLPARDDRHYGGGPATLRRPRTRPSASSGVRRFAAGGGKRLLPRNKYPCAQGGLAAKEELRGVRRQHRFVLGVPGRLPALL